MLDKIKIQERMLRCPEPPIVAELRDKIRDAFKDLEFFEEGHRYTLHRPDGDIALSSVTTIVHPYSREFDNIKVSENYAAKNGETPEYWRDLWDYNNLIATTTGTYVHEFGESLAQIRSGRPENICECCKMKYNEKHGWLIPTRPKEVAVSKFWEEMSDNLYVIDTEARIYNMHAHNPYSGTFDLLMYYYDPQDPEHQGVVLMDYKTNKSLTDDYATEHNIMLKAPFDDMVDCDYSTYTLQLNLYQYALEMIGIKVIGRRLVWLLPDETYQVIKVNDIQDKIRAEF